MAQTKAGIQKAKKTIIAKYGEDFYGKIGKIGGTRSNNGGFASNKVGKDGLTGKQRAEIAGAVGGAISKRPKRRHHE